jgi:hypothetical protein
VTLVASVDVALVDWDAKERATPEANEVVPALAVCVGQLSYELYLVRTVRDAVVPNNDIHGRKFLPDDCESRISRPTDRRQDTGQAGRVSNQ